MAQVKLSSEWLELEKAMGARPVLAGNYEEIRATYNGLGAMLAEQWGKSDESVKTEEQTTSNGVPVRIYTPPNATGKLPIGVYTHGGGFACGNLDSEDHTCRYVAKNTPCIIVSVDYRLAPEHQMPAQQDDSVHAFEWAHEHASSLGGNPSKVFSIGGSAGGTLALNTAVALVEKGAGSKIAGTVAIVPATIYPDTVPKEFESSYKSYQENAIDVPVLDKKTMLYFYEVAGADKLKDDSSVFPALYKKKAELPPTWIGTCGADPLRDDGAIMHQMLQDAGVKTKLDHYPELPHYFWIFPSITAGNKFREDVVEGVKFVLG